MNTALRIKFAKFGIILWLVVIVINYCIHHPAHLISLVESPNFQLMVVLSAITTAACLVVLKTRLVLNGWKIYLFILLLMVTIFFHNKADSSVFDQPILSQLFVFIGKMVLTHLSAFLIFCFSLSIGLPIVSLINSNITRSQKTIVSLSTGMGVVMMLLFLLGAFGLLTQWLLFPIIIMVILLSRKFLLPVLTGIFWQSIKFDRTKYLPLILTALLINFVALNLTASYGIFPMGFDGINLYQNVSNLIFKSQALIPGGQAYNWPLFTSMGAILFGKMSYSIFMTKVILLPTLWAFYEIARLFVKKTSALIAMLLIISMPAFAFHIFLDEKVDLAFLFFSESILLLLLAIGKNNEYKFITFFRKDWSVFALIGFLLGILMGIKYLAVIVLIAVVSFVIYGWIGIKGLIFSLLVSFSGLFLIEIHNFGYLEITDQERWFIVLLFAGLAIISIIISLKKINWSGSSAIFKNLALLGFFMIIGYSPWMVKNGLETQKFTPKSFLYGKIEGHKLNYRMNWLDRNGIDFALTNRQKNGILSDLNLKEANNNFSDKELTTKWKDLGDKRERNRINNSTRPASASTAKKEEIQRYLGYEKGIVRYLSMPLDITLNTNIPNKRGVDVGFLFLFILSLLLFQFKTSNTSFKYNLVATILVVVLFFVSWNAILNNNVSFTSASEHLEKIVPNNIGSLTEIREAIFQPIVVVQQSVAKLFNPIYALQSNMNFISILVGLMLIVGLMGVLFKRNGQLFSNGIKMLLAFIFSYAAVWWIIGNAITHYALVLWVGLIVVMIYYWENIDKFFNKELTKFAKNTLSFAIGLTLLLNTFSAFTNHNNTWKNMGEMLSLPFLYAASSIQTEQEILDRLNPVEMTIVKKLNTEENSGIYRIGTLLNYFIDNNSTRVYSDNQLGTFNKISKSIKNESDFLKVLKLNGIDYILFDMKVASIDNTPDKSLTKKANRLVSILNDQEKVSLLYTDNVIQRINPKTKEKVQGYGLYGQTVKVGTIALFKIN